MRRAGTLTIYLDGVAVAKSSDFAPADYNLDHGGPLRIGSGQHDYFNGRIADLRLYRGALGAREIEDLAS